MNLYAVYVDGHLLEQMPAENEDTAHAKIKMDYPKIKGDIEFHLVDENYVEPKEAVKLAAVVSEEETKPQTSSGDRQFTVIDADSIEITINVNQGALTKEAVDELERSAEKGLVIAKKKGN